MDGYDPYTPLRSSKSLYRRFLEESGIVEHLTRFLFKLYDEKSRPPYAIHYFRKHFGDLIEYSTPNMQHLRERLAAEREKVKELLKENDRLRTEISYYDAYYQFRPLKYKFPIFPHLPVLPPAPEPKYPKYKKGQQ